MLAGQSAVLILTSEVADADSSIDEEILPAMLYLVAFSADSDSKQNYQTSSFS